MKPLIEIDGKRIKYTDFYPEDECICGVPVGVVCGMNEDTTGELRSFLPGTAVGVVNVYRRSDKGIRGIKAIYKNATWAAGADDTPLFRVSERIA